MLSEATSDAITLSDLYLSRYPYCQGASANTLKGVPLSLRHFVAYLRAPVATQRSAMPPPRQRSTRPPTRRTLTTH